MTDSDSTAAPSPSAGEVPRDAPPGQERQRVRFRVSGRVQGVGFRVFVQREASLLGLSGWVRNTWDGRVEGEAEGAREALLSFQGSLRHGPPSGFVASCTVEPLPPLDDHGPFRITRDA